MLIIGGAQEFDPKRDAEQRSLTPDTGRGPLSKVPMAAPKVPLLCTESTEQSLKEMR